MGWIAASHLEAVLRGWERGKEGPVRTSGFVIGVSRTGCPPLTRSGKLTSLTGPLEAPLDCPRRKTADRNNPRMAQLIAHGGYPEGGTAPHRSEGS